jgi:outer membrane protein assembly factor BamB
LKDTIYAVDTATGAKKWSQNVGSPVRSGLAVADGVAYFGAEDNKVYAFDATTGAPKWPQPFTTKSKVLAMPTVSGELVYVQSLDRGLYALSTGTGSTKWAYDMGNEKLGAP